MWCWGKKRESGKHGPKQISCHLVASTDNSVFWWILCNTGHMHSTKSLCSQSSPWAHSVCLVSMFILLILRPWLGRRNSSNQSQALNVNIKKEFKICRYWSYNRGLFRDRNVILQSVCKLVTATELKFQNCSRKGDCYEMKDKTTQWKYLRINLYSVYMKSCWSGAVGKTVGFQVGKHLIVASFVGRRNGKSEYGKLLVISSRGLKSDSTQITSVQITEPRSWSIISLTMVAVSLTNPLWKIPW